MDDHKELLLRHRVKPEGAAYVSADDRLVFGAYNTVSSIVLQFSGYLLNSEGEVKYYQYELRPTSDRVISSRTEFMGECFILSCTAHISSGNANRGQCYVRVQVQRATGTPALPLARLIQGYLTDNYSPSFPGGLHEDPLSGQGMLRSITGTNPAAGVEISETVPTGARWLLWGLSALLVTGASGSTQLPHLMIDDGTNILIDIPTELAVGGNETNRFQTIGSVGIVGYGGATTNRVIYWQYPLPYKLFAGWRIRTVTDTIDTDDNWGAPQLFVEEWLEA